MERVSGRTNEVPRWVRAADAATLALVLLAVVVLLTDGYRTEVAGVVVSVTSETRILYWALAVAMVRHAAYRRVTLVQRVRASRRLSSLRMLLGIEHFIDTDQAPWLTPEVASGWRWRTAAEYLGVTSLMVVLTILLTYPQIAALHQVRDPGDPLFSVWRLAWIAHQLPRDPLNLFDANIFYPARYTLALSDSILLPGLVSAPFLWLGVSPVKAYNVWCLASFVLSGLSMYALVRALTGRPAAALVAAVAFAFYPFRFEHYSHFELQLSFWMPLVLLAVHRAVATGRLRYGLLAGAGLAAQTLSCMYFALFLVLFLVPVWVILAFGGRAIVRSIRPLLAGAVLAAVLVVPIAWQYLAARQEFGGRKMYEVTFYSPTPARYLVAHPVSMTWGDAWDGIKEHLPEQDLFPGLLIVALAFAAIWPPVSVSKVAYAAGLLVAFDASLGVHGHLFPLLYDYVAPFRSIRVPARLSMLVGMALAVLAGYGAARLLAMAKRPVARYALVAILCAVICFEVRPDITFQDPGRPHAIYGWLAGRPPTVLAELPTPGDVVARLWQDVRYQYFSTFHWHRLINGNSGILPPSYLDFSAQMTTFPDSASLALLRERGAEYVVVHEEFYDDAASYRRVVDQSERRADLEEVARAMDHGTEARVFRIVR